MFGKGEKHKASYSKDLLGGGGGGGQGEGGREVCSLKHTQEQQEAQSKGKHF